MAEPAITQIPSSRKDLFAFRIAGRIRKDDIESMARTLKAAFAELGTVDMIIVIKEWDGIDMGAVFDGESMSAQAEANRHVRKYAVVGAPGWAKAMINVMAPLTPVEERTFDLEEEDQAWTWIDGSDERPAARMAPARATGRDPADSPS